MIPTPLGDGWTLQLTAGPIPAGLPEVIAATVPGAVHTDLLAAGLIPDPYLDLNERDVQWVAQCDTRYRTTFDLVDSGHERIDLLAEGLDTVATVTLNGSELGRTKNQHRSYRFDLRSTIRARGNELVVDFQSPLRAARASEERIGAKPLVADALPYNALRKMACNFGWDWGPTLTTSGIWKPLSVHQWSTARIASVVPQVTVLPSGAGRVELHVELERTSEDVDLTLEATVQAGNGTAAHLRAAVVGSDAVLTLEVPDPELWWPRGYGGQPLYSASVRVLHHSTELDRWTHDIGFRTVELRMQPDDVGTSFEFHVNGQYVFIKGANWIPDDCFLTRVTRADYEHSVQDAVDAGMNMLRVWGGGIYESDDLYDVCNREGILVWQDFLFACAMYSEAPEMWAEVEAEARENVARLASNPSLVVWNGSNENVEGFFHWGFKERLSDDEQWGRGYYDDLLPRVLADVDPTRAYLPSSPFSPRDYANPRDPDQGTVHSWKVWFSEDYLTYRNAIPRFVAEFGFQGAPNWSTLVRAVHDNPLLPDSPGVLAHQRAVDGNGKLHRGYAPHLPEPTNFDDWHFVTQLNQARAITCGIEHFRSHSPRTSGSLVWQLNDCWPVTSWAAVDGDKKRKPLWYALRSVNAPRLLMLAEREGGLALIASNDSPEPWIETVQVRRISLAGAELARADVDVHVPPRTNQTVVLPAEVTVASDPTDEVLLAASSSTRRAYWYFVEDLELALPPLDLASTVQRIETGYAVTLTARAFAKDLVLNPDRVDPDATVDEMLITLLPGESRRFVVRSAVDLPDGDLVAHPVLQSVNSLVHPANSMSDVLGY